MNQELNVLDYKFGLESLESPCPPKEQGAAETPATPSTSATSSTTTAPIETAQAPKAMTMLVPSQLAQSTIVAATTGLQPTQGAVIAASTELQTAPAPVTIENLQVEQPSSISQSGIRRRVAPPPGHADDINEIVAAFKESSSSIVPLKLPENYDTQAQTGNIIAPHAVAPARAADFDSVFAPYRGSSTSEFKLQNDVTLTQEKSAQLPTHREKTADTKTTTPINEIAWTARDQEARALFSIKRGIKVFAILGAVLLVVLVYETTKQSMFKSIAESAAALGASSVALNIFDSQLAKDKSSVAILSAWANTDRSRGRLNNAIRYYTRAIALEPKDYVSYLNRGAVNFDLNQLKPAIADDSKAIALNSGCALAYNNRGLAYDAAGNYTQALSDFNKAISLTSAQPRHSFWLNRGACYLHMRHYKEAIQDFDLAIKHGSEPAKAPKEIAVTQAKHLHRLETKISSTHRHHHS